MESLSKFLDSPEKAEYAREVLEEAGYSFDK